jgi:hypothetical protein
MTCVENVSSQNDEPVQRTRHSNSRARHSEEPVRAPLANGPDPVRWEKGLTMRDDEESASALSGNAKAVRTSSLTQLTGHCFGVMAN